MRRCFGCGRRGVDEKVPSNESWSISRVYLCLRRLLLLLSTYPLTRRHPIRRISAGRCCPSMRGIRRGSSPLRLLQRLGPACRCSSAVRDAAAPVAVGGRRAYGTAGLHGDTTVRTHGQGGTCLLCWRWTSSAGRCSLCMTYSMLSSMLQGLMKIRQSCLFRNTHHRQL